MKIIASRKKMLFIFVFLGAFWNQTKMLMQMKILIRLIYVLRILKTSECNILIIFMNLKNKDKRDLVEWKRTSGECNSTWDWSARREVH